MKTPTERQMRKAIKSRDHSFDRKFVYAVITTGVFCRPSCAARAAKPENYRFYKDNQAAIAAGFRACKRCRPTEQTSDISNLIESARFIDAHAEQKLTLLTLAKRAGLSASRYQRAFKQALGVSPKSYQDAARLKRLKTALKSGDDISGAIFEAGYGSSSRVYGRAIKHTGMTPKAYREGGAGEQIVYACRDTQLGKLLMAATERGICFVQFARTKKALIEQLKNEFPNAQVSASKATQDLDLDAWMSALSAHLDQGKPRPDVPLDIRGTAFQIKVWRFLMTIPDGEVISYQELAQSIDQPKAYRAAASACGKNRIAVLVPCHRVLRSNGELGGYRWGLHRKRALLDAERERRQAKDAVGC